MIQTLVSSKYRVVIPKAIRKKVNITPGQKMSFDVIGNKIFISPAKRS